MSTLSELRKRLALIVEKLDAKHLIKLLQFAEMILREQEGD